MALLWLLQPLTRLLATLAPFFWASPVVSSGPQEPLAGVAPGVDVAAPSLRGPEVATRLGRVRGHDVVGTAALAYLGIPYAAPPLGTARWQPPGAAQPWEPEVLPGDKSGPPCIGVASPGASVEDMDEDCLRLDVYVPKGRWPAPLRQKLPVVVFLHGGDLVQGSAVAIQSGFGAAANATRLGAVSVVVNYRLAVLGFLALKPLAEADPRGVAGNYGFLDCVAALQWVQENIAAFGGDPAQVTVYGQSSGGSLVLALAASPLAGGLFRAGISMSGSPRLNFTVQQAAETWHLEALKRTRCVESKEVLACLRSLNKTELIAAKPPDWDPSPFSYAALAPGFAYAPLLLVDNGTALPRDYLAAYRDPDPRSPLGRGATLVIGATREEADFSPGDDVRAWAVARLRDFVRRTLGPEFHEAFVDAVHQAYGLLDGAKDLDLQEVYAQMVSDAQVFCPSLVLADAYTARKPPGKLYVYLTRQRPGSPKGFCPLKGYQTIAGYCPHYAFHAVDLFGLFTPDWNGLAHEADQGYNYTDRDWEYTKLLTARFSELASTGRVSAWREYRGGGGLEAAYSVVDLAAPGEANVVELRSQQCELWKPLYARFGLIN